MLFRSVDSHGARLLGAHLLDTCSPGSCSAHVHVVRSLGACSFDVGPLGLHSHEYLHSTCSLGVERVPGAGSLEACSPRARSLDAYMPGTCPHHSLGARSLDAYSPCSLEARSLHATLGACSLAELLRLGGADVAISYMELLDKEGAENVKREDWSYVIAPFWKADRKSVV